MPVKQRGLPPGDARHGTMNGYSNYHCRCADCRKANAAVQRRRQAQRRAAGPPPHVHGTTNGYDSYGCRCADCADAKNAERRRYYADHLSNAARGVPSRSEVCGRGHQLTGENLYLRRDGRKMCRACQSRRNREYRARAARLAARARP